MVYTSFTHGLPNTGIYLNEVSVEIILAHLPDRHKFASTVIFLFPRTFNTGPIVHVVTSRAPLKVLSPVIRLNFVLVIHLCPGEPLSTYLRESESNYLMDLKVDFHLVYRYHKDIIPTMVQVKLNFSLRVVINSSIAINNLPG